MELRYFSLSEFASPDIEGSGKEMSPKLLECLDDIRDEIGIPFIINSGYRSYAHNQKVGGSVRSQHLSGHAVDIAIANQLIGDQIQAAFIARVGQECGIGRYVTKESGAGFIHLDIRGYKARWSNQAYKDWIKQ